MLKNMMNKDVQNVYLYSIYELSCASIHCILCIHIDTLKMCAYVSTYTCTFLCVLYIPFQQTLQTKHNSVIIIECHVGLNRLSQARARAVSQANRCETSWQMDMNMICIEILVCIPIIACMFVFFIIIAVLV